MISGYKPCHPDEGRRTDAYKWACAQLEALDAYLNTRAVVINNV